MTISWSTFNFEGDIGPRPRRTSPDRGRVDLLERKIDMLALICQAMWEIMREHGGIPEQMLADKVEEIDLRDGVRDGKLAKGNTKCSKCGKMINRKHDKCLYCGTPKKIDEVFDRL